LPTVFRIGSQDFLIDLGTFGGPASFTAFPARALNNRGQMIAFADTALADPNCFFD
jgi:hypothetical protein